MKFSDFVPIIVTLISTAGAIICALVGRKPPPESAARAQSRPLNFWAAGMWICIVVAVAALAIFGWQVFRPKPGVEVTIIYPTDQAQVEQTETVRGTAQRIPDGAVVWVVVYSQEVGRYYPQNQPADLEAMDQWSSVVYIGVPSDVGLRFDVLAVLADADGQNAFNVYLAEARDQSNWVGLAALPDGVVIYDRVTVTRK